MTSKKQPCTRTYLFASPLIALLLSVSGQAGTVPPIWETNFGSPVAFLPDADDGTVKIDFGFAFPFLGNNYTSARLSTNGFLWLNPDNTSPGGVDGVVNRPDPLDPGFLNGDPRIAGGWFDLNGLNTGSVDFNTFGGNRAVITYVGVPECCFAGSYTFQIQLLATGTIVFGYNGFPTPAISHDILIGVTPGNNAADPGNSDLLNGTPFTSSGGTVYEFISRSNGEAFGAAVAALNTFEGSDIVFDRTTDGSGFNVTTQTAVVATPEPATLGMLGLGAVALLGLARRKRVRL